MSEAECGRAANVLAEARGHGLVDLKVDEDGNVNVMRPRRATCDVGEAVRARRAEPESSSDGDPAQLLRMRKRHAPP